MAPTSSSNQNILHSQRTRLFVFLCIAASVWLLPSLAFAQEDALGRTCGVANSLHTLLNAISIVVVTIAVIFSGYQIAFAHKRISDVAPVLIGAVLIGAAGQIAKLFLGGTATDGCSNATSAVIHVLTHYA